MHTGARVAPPSQRTYPSAYRSRLAGTKAKVAPGREGGYVYVLASAYIISPHSARVWRACCAYPKLAALARFVLRSRDAEMRGTCRHRFASEIPRASRNPPRLYILKRIDVTTPGVIIRGCRRSRYRDVRVRARAQARARAHRGASNDENM